MTQHVFRASFQECLRERKSNFSQSVSHLQNSCVIYKITKQESKLIILNYEVSYPKLKGKLSKITTLL